MTEGSLSASDVAMLAGRNDGWGGDGWGGMIWLFAILALMGGGFGGWGNNNFANAIGYENLATSNEVQRGFDNQNLQAQTRDILSAVTNGTAESVAATNGTFHDMLAAFNDKYGELQRDIAGLAVGQANSLAKMNECCCETLRAIDGVNYASALNTAAINENTTAQTQKILDAIAGNRIADMQNQINGLQLANALSGVVRYPTNTYYAVPSPCFNTCGCGNI